jgi:hypothetical protein
VCVCVCGVCVWYVCVCGICVCGVWYVYVCVCVLGMKSRALDVLSKCFTTELHLHPLLE